MCAAKISLYHQSFDRKKDRTNRSILTLKQINEDADPILVHFKMDSLKSAIHPLKQNSLFASISKMHFFRYRCLVKIGNTVLLGCKTFSIVCVLMSLTTSPCMFTKIIQPVYTYLRKTGHSFIAYIDNSLLQRVTYETRVKIYQTQ